MASPMTLSGIPDYHPSMDYTFLRQEGIHHIEKMAGMLWTDFNAHDPGITILEQLCYAITDLGYRIAFEIPDLLATDSCAPYESLYSPAQALTSHPVTRSDMRKLVLDVEGVKNVWIEKVETQAIPLHYYREQKQISLREDDLQSEPIRLKGLYRVLIETSDLEGIDGTTVHRNVVRRLHANRNLCEDFEAIKILEPQKIQVNARVEIGAIDRPEEILLDIYKSIADYLSPQIPFFTLPEMLAAGKSVNDIFDGPVLNHGFIDSDALNRSSRKTTIHTSDLIHEMMNLPGVTAVKSITVSANDKTDKWSLELDKDQYPQFDLETSRIYLEKNQVTVSLDYASAIDHYYQRRRKTAVRPRLAPGARDIIPPAGRDRDVGNYFSILHQFPTGYGVGETGLSEPASSRSKARAKQLKAYLMFFDQLLANYFAQLAHVRNLFSFHSQSHPTYFTRLVNDKVNAGLGLEEIQALSAEDLAALAGESISAGKSARRRDRFLNHLMARFAEQFTEYALILFGINPIHASPSEKLIADKRAFLRNFPRISSARGSGCNYLLPPGGNNTSGLEDRIRLKLGLMPEKGERFYMVEHILLRPMVDDAKQIERDEAQIPFLAASAGKDPFSLQLSFVFPTDWPERFDPGKASDAIASDTLTMQKGRLKSFVEQTVREETPAHLTPYVHWLNKDDMAKFEKAYTNWMQKRSSAAASGL